MFLSHNTFFYFKIHIKNLFDLKSKVVAKGNKSGNVFTFCGDFDKK